MTKKPLLLSVIVPCYNEGSNIVPFFEQLKAIKTELKPMLCEFIYVNDGSKDNTLDILHELSKQEKDVKIVNLSRNFGKEIATSAGIHFSKGDAVIMIDADGQHPAKLIPKFVSEWQNGFQVVVGVRKTNRNEGLIKRYGSIIFYRLFNRLTGTALIPGSTDFRLIDKVVQEEFIKMTERNRITRGLIDWLGFNHGYVYFHANERMSGDAAYSISKLIKLALNSFVSLSLKPLYFSLYAGAVILPFSLLTAVFSGFEMLIGDPLHLRITGTAFMVMLVLFCMGILLISQGLVAVYLSHVHTETQNRPLFVLDKSTSHGINLEEI